MSRLTVLGASGFVGQAILHAAAVRHVSTRAVARTEISSVAAGVTSVRVASYFETPAAESDGEVLVHLAQSGLIDGQHDVAAAISLVEHILKIGYQYVCFASSAAVYGDADSQPHRPDEALEPPGRYAALKLQCERLVLEAGGSAARFTNLYGPGQSEASVLARVLSQIPGTGPVRLKTLLPVRDFCWVQDAADAVVALCAAGVRGVFNVGSGTSISVGELARVALAVANEEDRALVAEEAGPISSVLRVDISETTIACGWRPCIELKTGLAQLIENRR